VNVIEKDLEGSLYQFGGKGKRNSRNEVCLKRFFAEAIMWETKNALGVGSPTFLGGGDAKCERVRHRGRAKGGVQTHWA